MTPEELNSILDLNFTTQSDVNMTVSHDFILYTIMVAVLIVLILAIFVL